jgi:hypothetical protein
MIVFTNYLSHPINEQNTPMKVKSRLKMMSIKRVREDCSVAIRDSTIQSLDPLSSSFNVSM